MSKKLDGYVIFVKSHELARILDIPHQQVLKDIREEIVNISKSSLELPDNTFVDRTELDENNLRRNIYLISAYGILLLLPRYGYENYPSKHKLIDLYDKLNVISKSVY